MIIIESYAFSIRMQHGPAVYSERIDLIPQSPKTILKYPLMLDRDSVSSDSEISEVKSKIILKYPRKEMNEEGQTKIKMLLWRPGLVLALLAIMLSDSPESPARSSIVGQICLIPSTKGLRLISVK
jgi:hypothetical protein